jgi:ribosomal protein S18 acetylase RimI-like enzyme
LRRIGDPVVCWDAAVDGEVVITRGTAADLTALGPLWVDVHHRHAESMPELAPYVNDAETWAEHRKVYEEVMAKPGTVLLLARIGDELVGYGVAHVLPASGSWLADTWVTGARVGEIESLAVRPGHRGKGIGGRLLDGLEAALAADGVEDLVLGVLPGNDAARRLYERRGYRPTWMYLSKLAGRGG